VLSIYCRYELGQRLVSLIGTPPRTIAWAFAANILRLIDCMRLGYRAQHTP